nr:immunoglobulin heavy chain junction region [Macaca mulatta]
CAKVRDRLEWILPFWYFDIW